MKIAFVTTGADNYYSLEYQVHARSLEVLRQLEAQGKFALTDIPEEIRTAEDFRRLSGQMRGADMLLVQCGGFTDGTLVPLLAELGIPLCIWAVEEPTDSGDIRLHSLVTQNLFFGILKKYCGSGLRMYPLNGDCGMMNCLEDFLDILAVEGLCRELRNGRICQIGGEAYGFLNLAEDEKALAEKFGIQIEYRGVPALVARAKSFSQEEVARVLDRVCSETVQDAGLGEYMERSARIYLALRELTSEGYMGLAVSCWPELQDEYSMVPCAAFSWLVEYDGIPVSCEGDIGGLLSMLILQRLSGTKPSLLDLTQYNREKDAVLFWHCGFSPASFAEKEDRLILHPMLNRRMEGKSRLGVSQDFRFHEGRVTVLRVTGRDMKLFAFEARVSSDVGAGFTGTRTWLTDFSMWDKTLSAQELIDLIMHEGVEHHYALVFGRITKRLRLFSRINKYEVVNQNT